MKFLVLSLIVFAGIWWIRQQRQSHASSQKRSPLEVMIACAHCGTHLPESDAIRGERGLYCSHEHRAAHEG